MNFTEIVTKRYATKKFDGRTVSQEQLDHLLELIRLAPSSFNIQPWRIYVVSDHAVKQEIQSAAWNQHQIGTSSHVLVFCADTRIAEKIDALERLMIEHGASKEDIAGYIQMMRDFEKNLSSEAKLAWAQRQLYLALGNAVNGAKSLGFDSCPMEGFDPKALALILKAPSYIVPTALCPIGYAADTPREKMRFPKKDVFG